MIEIVGILVLLCLVLVFELKQNRAKKKQNDSMYKCQRQIEGLIDSVRKNHGLMGNRRSKGEERK